MNVVVYPNAKLNIGLHVLDKREDGYHNIESLFIPYFDLTDILEIVESDSTELFKYGIPYDGDLRNDLIYKAYSLLRKDFDLPEIQIHIYKNIPVGAGLGGGSSDASSMLIALNKLFSLGIDESRLTEYAAELGSDTAFFIHNRAMFGEGRGEKLTPFSSPSIDELIKPDGKYRIELITPSINISTPEAYRGIVPRNISGKKSESLKTLLKLPIEDWRGNIENDFEESIFRTYPQLSEIKHSLYDRGAIYASMSGSGSSIYAIFYR